jgi:hypothetical protein
MECARSGRNGKLDFVAKSSSTDQKSDFEHGKIARREDAQKLCASKKL